MLDRDSIRFDGIFVAPELEQSYRNSQARDDKRRAQITIGAALVMLVYFGISDFVFLGAQLHFYLILTVRTVILATSVVSLLWLRGDRTPLEVDRVLFAWLFMMSVALVCLACAPKASYTSHAVINVLYVVLMYSIVPLPLACQVICPVFVSLGVVFLGNWVNPWPDPAVLVVVCAALVLANGLGAEMSRQLNHWKRRQFLALTREKETRQTLEHALAEIKTLRGILPICTHCKRIWNDAGFWEQVEVYVHNHTHAEFSHGLCPTCARRHYPDIDWEKKGL
jgi:hypothetical protein